jgi:hypothetical protein
MVIRPYVSCTAGRPSPSELTSTSFLTRCGYFNASSSATRPPSDAATTDAERRPRLSMYRSTNRVK